MTTRVSLSDAQKTAIDNALRTEFHMNAGVGVVAAEHVTKALELATRAGLETGAASAAVLGSFLAIVRDGGGAKRISTGALYQMATQLNDTQRGRFILALEANFDGWQNDFVNAPLNPAAGRQPALQKPRRGLTFGNAVLSFVRAHNGNAALTPLPSMKVDVDDYRLLHQEGVVLKQAWIDGLWNQNHRSTDVSSADGRALLALLANLCYCATPREYWNGNLGFVSAGTLTPLAGKEAEKLLLTRPDLPQNLVESLTDVSKTLRIRTQLFGRVKGRLRRQDADAAQALAVDVLVAVDLQLRSYKAFGAVSGAPVTGNANPESLRC